MEMLYGVSSDICLLLHGVVLEAVAILRAIFFEVNHFRNINNLKAVLVFSPDRILRELLVLV